MKKKDIEYAERLLMEWRANMLEEAGVKDIPKEKSTKKNRIMEKRRSI